MSDLGLKAKEVRRHSDLVPVEYRQGNDKSSSRLRRFSGFQNRGLCIMETRIEIFDVCIYRAVEEGNFLEVGSWDMLSWCPVKL
jgi:hypothetical protein